MLLRPYEMPWRPAYEAYAGAAWLIAFTFYTAAGLFQWMPVTLAFPLAGACLLMVILRTHQALRNLVLRASLSGTSVEHMPTSAFAGLCRDPDAVFLGFGFDWLPVHAQRLYELSKIDYRDLTVSPRLLGWLGHPVRPQSDAEIGLPYIHGVEPREKALYRPLQNFEGALLLVRDW